MWPLRNMLIASLIPSSAAQPCQCLGDLGAPDLDSAFVSLIACHYAVFTAWRINHSSLIVSMVYTPAHRSCLMRPCTSRREHISVPQVANIKSQQPLLRRFDRCCGARLHEKLPSQDCPFVPSLGVEVKACPPRCPCAVFWNNFCNEFLSFAAVLLYQEPDYNGPFLAAIFVSHQMVNRNSVEVFPCIDLAGFFLGTRLCYNSSRYGLPPAFHNCVALLIRVIQHGINIVHDIRYTYYHLILSGPIRPDQFIGPKRLTIRDT